MTRDFQTVIVTGMSGAGMSTTLDILEDQGFEALGNLPVRLLETVLAARVQPMAIEIDVRTRDFNATALGTTISRLKQSGQAISLLFLDCSDDELLRRFSKVKRPHPFRDRQLSMAGKIQRERTLLEPVRDNADHLIDTTDSSIWEHRQRVLGLNLGTPRQKIQLRLVSFSFGKGIPRDADLVFDVRFLRNPHYDPDLREKDGTNPDVQHYIAEDDCFGDFLDTVVHLLNLTLGRYDREGKASLTVAFGCTGGQHRSIAMAEALARRYAEGNHPDCQIHVFHREKLRREGTLP